MIIKYSSQIPHANPNENGEDKIGDDEIGGSKTCICGARDSDEPQQPWKAIPLQDYNELKQLVPLVKKLQNEIDKMKNKIASLELELEDERIAHKRLQNNCVNVSNLTIVNIFLLNVK